MQRHGHWSPWTHCYVPDSSFVIMIFHSTRVKTYCDEHRASPFQQFPWTKSYSSEARTLLWVWWKLHLFHCLVQTPLPTHTRSRGFNLIYKLFLAFLFLVPRKDYNEWSCILALSNGPSKTQSIRQIHQLWDIAPKASPTVSAFLTFIPKWLDDKRIQFVFWIQGEKICLIKLFCFVAIHHFLPKCKTKPVSFHPSLFKTSIMIDFHCIFFFHFMNEFFKPKFGCCLLMAPQAFKESFFTQKASCRSRQTGKEVVWVNNESWARDSHGGMCEAGWIG